MTDLSPAPFRVGQAFDIHAHADDPDRVLVLGGVAFEGERGLAGHSDADVLAHVCADALLEPPGSVTSARCSPTPTPVSKGLTASPCSAMQRSRPPRGWQPGNIDLSVVLDRPKLAPVKDLMQRNLSGVGAPVTVTGRRTGGVGALGRGEGIAAWAVALVFR